MLFSTWLVQSVLQKFSICEDINKFPIMYACSIYVSGFSANILIKKRL